MNKNIDQNQNKDLELEKSNNQNNDIRIDESKLINTDYGLVKDRKLTNEMQSSYLDYAMSVIVSRALPDVRDGLKPVHRRVLFSMHEIGLKSTSKFRKSATVVGDVLGKYHPHGDTAVYDTMVRMAQNFSMRYPLVNGQGNFGSMDGDNAAAMRYTEAKMHPLSEEILSDIEKDTVDFVPNYDGTRVEPKVLPAKVPQLLLNGTLGIAVGMATNIPPHNLGEVIDATKYLIDNPEADVDALMQYIQGPDFPTGANIYNIEDIKTAYATGKGRVLMRAVADIEEKKKGGFRIIISEIPYQVNKADLITKIANLVKNKKIIGITDIRDESDRNSGVRIVIELKSNAYPKKILNRLYTLTPMQSVFHVNMIALVDGIQPKLLTLKDVLSEYIKHRQIVVRRRVEFDLKKAKDRAHILEGLKKALDHIDEIIKVIKKSKDREIAKDNLIKDFKLSEKQAIAILEMKLSTLSGLERKKIEDELLEKIKLIKELENILSSEKKILEIIKDELDEIKQKYSDKRRTKIYKQKIGDFSFKDLVPNEQVIFTLTKSNYVKRVPVASYRAQKRGGKGVAGMETKEEDSVDHLIITWTHNDLLFFTDKGRVFSTKVYEIPSYNRQAKGVAMANLIQISPDEKVTAVIPINKDKKNPKYLFFSTEKGIIKKTEFKKFDNIRKSGVIAIKLKNNDCLKWVKSTSGEDKIIIITHQGKAIYFSEKDARPMGRSASGVRGIKLKDQDKVISTDMVQDETSDVFTILEKGYGKRTKISNFTLQKRGGIGIRASKVTNKTGPVVEALIVDGSDGDVVIISQKGQVIRTSLKSVKRLGRDTQGVTLMRLNSSDKVASMTIYRKTNDSEEDIQDDLLKSGNNDVLELGVKDDKNIINNTKSSDQNSEIKKTKKRNSDNKKITKEEKMTNNSMNPKSEFKPVIKAQIKKKAIDKGNFNKFKPQESQITKDSNPNWWGGDKNKG